MWALAAVLQRRALTASRLVVVLGYSDSGGEGLHEICAARLRLAERETGANDVVLLSGWARGRSAISEAELMARSWNASCGRLVIDDRARSTLGNVIRAAALVRDLSVREVVLVTSGWHGRRAAALLRAVLRGSSATVTLAVTDERASRGSKLRELACWALVPFAGVAARKR
jgi:uncharacterized SAM-binding protein YcdF (DUF218 family)